MAGAGNVTPGDAFRSGTFLTEEQPAISAITETSSSSFILKGVANRQGPVVGRERI